MAETEYKQNLKDRYVGDIDPETKLRHGTGTYTYPNTYFQYQGSWSQGVKNSVPDQPSALIMRDGTSITGDFKDGEITGTGIKHFPDGRVYRGDFLEGEMHGQGRLEYNMDLKGEKNNFYEGEFQLNSREG